MDYWHDLLTEKSWKLLQELKRKFPFVLIGGWAVYLWAHTHKSKDINIIVNFDTLEQLKKAYDLRKHEHLRKYEIRQEEIDVDIYVPHYSQLALPLETVETAQIEGFTVAKPEYLLILKQAAELDRAASEKGEKDRIDILSLLFNCSIDLEHYRALLQRHKLVHFRQRLQEIVRTFSDQRYLNLTPRQLKLKKEEVLRKL